MGSVIMWVGWATATSGDCSTAGCGNCANSEAVEDMFWGTEGYGSTVSEMKRESGTIYGGVAV